MPHRQGDRHQGTYPNREKRVFEKRRFNQFSGGAEAVQHHKVDRYAVLRRQALNKLVAETDQGISRVALLCELSEDRVRRLSEGADPLDSHLAMHIEVSLGLPSGWLDRGAEGILPEEAKQYLKEGMPGSKNEVDWADLVTDETVLTLDAEDASADARSQDGQSEEFDAFVDAISDEGEQSPDSVSTASGSSVDEPLHQPTLGTSSAGSVHRDEGSESEEQFVSQEAQGAETMNQDMQHVQHGAARHHAADNPSAQEAADAVPVYLMIKEFFPAVRSFLNKNTSLSAATISGALSGSRQLTPQNARLFEQAMGVPEGWLEKELTFEKAKKEFERYAPHLTNLAAPRRGRRPGQPAPRKRVAEVTASATLPPATRFDVPPPAPEAAVAPQQARRTLSAPRRPAETRQLQGAPIAASEAAPTRAAPQPQAQERPVQAAAPVPVAPQAAPVAQSAQAPQPTPAGGQEYTLAQAFAKTIDAMVANNQLDNRKVAQLLGVLYS